MLQAFGYALLDGDDAFSLTHVGWYYARHQWRQSFALDALAQRLTGYSNVASLRLSFWQNVVEKERVIELRVLYIPKKVYYTIPVSQNWP